MINNNLNEDVVIEILLRLPLNSLMRFKCVRKSWCVVIESPQFAAMQFCNNSSNCLLVNCWKLIDAGSVEPESLSWSLLKYEDRMQAISNWEDDSFPMKHFDRPQIWSRSSHCDGIICLYDDSTTIMANLGIREFMVLPKSCIPLSGSHEEGYYEKFEFFGFGLDHRTNDYKIVRIKNKIPFDDRSPREYQDDSQAEVYTLSSNSWRQIEYSDFLTFVLNTYLSTYWNGAYYWSAVQKRPPPDDLVFGVYSFDFTNEVFYFKIIPDYVKLPSFLHYGMTEFNGTLALISYHYYDPEKILDIWVMDELGVNGVNRWVISLHPTILLPGK
ncbi:hypothetical protein SLEP1_g42965 [Rubroshorea leprosula]|uniref:F-box associated beta-propeller type 3 domain-containing protein n=1 Tax=Rubroshorea leprosula TaxID=152421 RepID=A0AAV5LCZ6_9ROSI|nr:hypothetical protein SLEP1_g42965 [Rubroshorea leprosula]